MKNVALSAKIDRLTMQINATFFSPYSEILHSDRGRIGYFSWGGGGGEHANEKETPPLSWESGRRS